MSGNYQFSMTSQVSDDTAGPFGGAIPRPAKIEYRTGAATTTNQYGGRHALTAGALTVNLGTLAAIGGGTLNLTGAVIKGYAIHNRGANAMVFKEGAVNGFPLFTTGGTPLPAGGYMEAFAPGAAGYGTVAVGDIAIDVTGTGTEQFDLILMTAVATV